MYEFEVVLYSGEHVIIFGYSYKDALNRSHVPASTIDFIKHQEYVD